MASCGFNLPRNAQGFQPAAGGGQVGACSKKVLRYAPDDTTGITQAVDNLMVRGRLLTNQQVGGTLTLQGFGSANPTYDAALCVRAGANIQGLTQSGVLRVVGESYMGGPVALSAMYGPVTVSNAPDAVPVEEVLTIDGTASSVQFNTGILNSDVVNADVFAANVFTIDGINGGPYGPAITAAEIDAALVSLTCTVGGITYNVQGVVVAPQRILMCGTWGKDTGTSPVPVAFAQAVTVTVLQPGLGEKAFAATVFSICPTANLALLAHTTTYTRTVVTTASALDSTPLTNSPVIIGTGRSELGVSAFQSGVVTNPSANMLYQYTSLHVATTGAASTLANSSIGAPIFDLRGQLLAIVQYGTPNSDYNGRAAIFTTVIGGIKANYIQYFINKATLSSNVEFPVTSLAIRPIRRWERSTTLRTGGLSSVAVTSTTSPSTQVITFSSPDVLDSLQIPLGVLGQNIPAFQDLVLLADIDSTVTVTYGDLLAVSTATTVAGTAFVNSTYWSILETCPTSGPSPGNIGDTSIMNAVYVTGGVITNLQFNLDGLNTLRGSQTQYIAMIHGKGGAASTGSQFYITCGLKTAIQPWMLANAPTDAYNQWLTANGAPGQTANFNITITFKDSATQYWDANSTPILYSPLADFSIQRQGLTDTYVLTSIAADFNITMYVEAIEYDYFTYEVPSKSCTCTMVVDDATTPSITYLSQTPIPPPGPGTPVAASLSVPTSVYP